MTFNPIQDLKTYMAIDPGAKGCIVICSGCHFEFHYLADYADLHDLAELFRMIAAQHPVIHCCMEDVKAVHGSSSTATFSFGLNKGSLLALLCAFGIPYTLVTPQRWQRAIWTAKDMEYTYTGELDNSGSLKKKVNTKKTSIAAAKRIFPQIDLRRTSKCKNPDDNKADALLICEYARRQNL